MDLPDVYQADLDAQMVTDLFADLAGAEVLSVTAKGREESYAAEDQLSLDDARDALLAKRVLGIQVIYRHEERTWRDTLMVTAAGVRLIRILSFEQAP